jgi:hypothetical protein
LAKSAERLKEEEKIMFRSRSEVSECPSNGLMATFASVSLLIFLSFSANLTAAPSKLPTGLIKSDASQNYPGYTVFSVKGKDAVFVLDMDGNVIHRWNIPGVCAQLKPLPKGHILVIVDPGRGQTNMLREYNWGGKVVWEFRLPEGYISFNHDLVRLPNGNTLVNASIEREVHELVPRPVIDNDLLEISQAGEIVWKWSTLDHFDKMGLSEEAKQYIREGPEIFDIFHTNSIQPLPPNRYEAEDSRFKSGNLLVSQRNSSIMLIIERPSGSVVWSAQKTIAQHHASMIPPTLMGGGDIIVFDNGAAAGFPRRWRPYSVVREFNPQTLQDTWTYQAADNKMAPDTFFSLVRSSAQRLPNDNTLIVESTFGRIFEVTYDKKKIVWEYVSPYFRYDDTGRYTNQIYRAYRVDYTWPKGAVGPGEEPFIW